MENKSSIYGPFDFANADDFENDMKNNTLVINQIVKPDPANPYYTSVTQVNLERLEAEKIRIVKITQENARFESQKKTYFAWLQKKRQHELVSNRSFLYPSPKVDQDVIEYFEKLEQDEN